MTAKIEPDNSRHSVQPVGDSQPDMDRHRARLCVTAITNYFSSSLLFLNKGYFHPNSSSYDIISPWGARLRTHILSPEIQ